MTRRYSTRCILAAVLTCASAPGFAQEGPPPGPPPGAMPDGMGPPPPMPMMADTHYDTAITIANGVLSSPIGSDVAAASPFSASLIDHVAVKSAINGRNGLIVSGMRSAVTVSHVKFDMAGRGANDFLGIGAGVMVRDHATMVIDHAMITTNGAVASAVVAAEGATLRIYDSILTANGGALPPGYVSHIGPGMMEPPAPLGLSGTARTLLAMSNSHTYVYHSEIIADGWGALSTDAAGNDLYLEADDCKITVRHAGYATYADFGAHVMINHSQVDTAGYVGIIAGKARIDLSEISGHAAFSAVMIHSIMGDPQQIGTLTLAHSAISTGGPMLLVKSANAEIAITGGNLISKAGILLEVRKNDDANATQTHGVHVPGVHLVIARANLTGDVVNNDRDRDTYLDLHAATLAGALHRVTLRADAASHWIARANSDVTITGDLPISAIDAPGGVMVAAKAADLPAGSHTLPSGGVLIVTN